MVLNGRNLARHKRPLAASLVLLIVLLIVMSFFSHLARADMLLHVYGTVHLVNHGSPYDKASTLTLMCPIYRGITGDEKLWPIAESRCLGDTCSVYSFTGSGFCSAMVKVADGRVFTFEIPQESPDFEFESEIDRDTWGKLYSQDVRFEAELDVEAGWVLVHNVFANSPRPFPTLSLGRWELFLIALLLTCIIEVPTVLAAGKYLFRFGGLRARRWLLVGLGANLITLPLVWFVVPDVFVLLAIDYRLVVSSTIYPLIVTIVEGAVALVEAEIYHRFVLVKRQHAFALSLVANALSYGAGLVLF